MLKNRTLIGIVLIVAAIGLCFGISPLFNTILASKTTIIRLKQDIPQGVQITGSMLEAVEVGSMNLPADMQNDPKKIIGKYSVTAMFAGDSFNDKKLSDTIDTSDSLLRQLKPNETAMSVTVKSLANGLSGKLQQGDIIQIVSVDEDDKAQILRNSSMLRSSLPRQTKVPITLTMMAKLMRMRKTRRSSPSMRL